jgi:hypothetical protein
MPLDTINLPLIGRAASVTPESLNTEARTIDIVWTTGAVVQRARWEGWDDIVEYDEELVVSANAVRLERLQSGAPFLDSHNGYALESVIGSVVPGSVRIEGGQGFATIRLTSAADAEPQVQRIMDGTVKFVSVGYRVHRYEITKQDGKRELWRAVDWEPFEISAVAMPADAGAHIRAADGQTEQARNPCIVVRHDVSAATAANPKGHTMPNETPAGGAETVIRSDAHVIEQRTATPVAPAPTPVSPDAILAAERQRVADITALARRHGVEDATLNDLVSRGVSIDQARATILDALAERGAVAGGVSASPAQPRAEAAAVQETQYRDAVTNAIQHRLNPGVVELAESAREFRGMRLLEIARAVLERRGVSTRGMSGMEVATAAFETRSGGLHSTSDFPIILANVANRTLRRAYDSTPRTFTAWARRSTAMDFKQITRAQLGGAPDLLRVPEGAEYKSGTIGEGKEVYALSTYGRKIGLTRQAIIGDDMSAFDRLIAAFGASAADLESDIVYKILMDNPVMGDGTALFHANHGNLMTAAAITETSLAAAYRAFGAQKGLEGRLVSILPSFILTPPGTRSVEARKQVAATTPNSTADVNTFANRLTPIEEPRLIPAAGADPWFLASDSSRIDTVEFSYLDGQEGVYTEMRAGFDVDGLEIKARHDFAAKAIDWRGLMKNAGI